MIRAVVVSYEAEEHLARCLASLEPLARAGNEVVVVDNGSSDSSTEIVAANGSWCQLMRLESNSGFGRACNLGSADTEAEHILFLNPDAWLEEGSVEVLVESLERDPRVGLVAPQLYSPDGRRQFTWEPSPGLMGDGLRRVRNLGEGRSWAHDGVRLFARALGDAGWMTAACVLVRRQAWQQVGGFDEGFFLYFEDVDLCLRLRRAGWRLRLVPSARAGHFKGGARKSGEWEVEYRRSQYLFYRRYRSEWVSRLLVRWQRRRFETLPEGELKSRLLAVCAEAELAWRKR